MFAVQKALGEDGREKEEGQEQRKRRRAGWLMRGLDSAGLGKVVPMAKLREGVEGTPEPEQRGDAIQTRTSAGSLTFYLCLQLGVYF